MDKSAKDTISVIVAIYNVERYLSKCIESILSQTYENLDIILINDGSTDKSGEICDKYAAKDSRIRVIHRENKGVAYTRNQGISVAKGEYLTFVDSDDYIHPQMYEILMEYLHKHQAEVAACDYEKVTDTQKVNIINKTDKKFVTNIIESRQDKKRYMYLEQYGNALLVWNKIFKKELWNGIQCPEGKVYEDETVTFKILHRANKIVNIREELYYHVKRANSITAISFSPKRLQRLDALETRIIYYIENNDWEFLSEAFFVYKTDLLVVMKRIMENSEYTMHMLKPYMKKYRWYCRKYLGKMKMPAKKKLQYIFFSMFPMIYFKRYKHKK